MANENDSLEEQIAAFDPTDPEQLAKLEQTFAGEPDEQLDDDDQLDDLDADAAKQADKAETAADDQDKQDKAAKPDEKADKVEGDASTTQNDPQGVVARDGKHVIPYSVLERERERATRAEATAKALNEQIEALKAGKDPKAEGDNAAQMTETDLTEIEDISPEIAKIIKAQMSKIEELSGKVVTLQSEQEVSKKVQESALQDDIDTAISSNSELSKWQEAAFRKENPDPARWDRACAFDDMLRSDPEWKDRSFGDRFAKAVDMTKAFYGDKPEQPGKQPPKKTDADLKREAEEKLKARGDDVPTSLSDIPGDSNVAQSDIETLDNTSTLELGEKFLNMNLEQQEAYLARLGI